MRLGLSRNVAVLAVGAIAAGGLAAGPMSPAAAAAACNVQYSVTGEWPGGFQSSIVIKNLGDAMSTWTLSFALPSGQNVQQSWGGQLSAGSSTVSLSNLSWNGNLATNATTTAGLIGSGDSKAVPSDFALNGKRCNGGAAPAVNPAAPVADQQDSSVEIDVPAVDAEPANDQPATNVVADTGASQSGNLPATDLTLTVPGGSGGASTYEDAFLALYDKLHDPANGYFSPEGVPYHSIEELIVEAPDWGHQTTSEGMSYYLWLEAQYGRIKGDWAPFNKAWEIMEKYMIPSRDKFKFGGYNTSDGSDYAPEGDQPSEYPVTRDPDVKVGSDPIYSELKSAYGDGSLYSMHWIIDTDNAYGYGECGDGTTKPAYINTFQRGPQESTWETVTQPSCETFKFGSSNGYLPIFMKEDSYAQQWRFTDAPDADARAIQAAYWALTWAKEQGKASAVSATVQKAAKMGDYLRYAMYDKHFKKPGCTSTSCAAATGKDGATYLINWYFAWGGAMDGAWSFLIGSSGFHQGYQNPLAAYVLSTVSELTPKGSSAKEDWSKAVTRQIEFLTWLQSSEGAFAGGANNSWNGRYEAGEGPRFYGLAYDWAPVWRDPPSNRWFGFQAWGIERLAEYYYVSKDAKVKPLLDKWVKWALENTTIDGADYQFPSDLTWTGKPGGDWTSSSSTVNNSSLHVKVENYTNDIGVAGSYAKLLTYYAAATGDEASAEAAKGLIDGIMQYEDEQGYALEETRKDYNRFGPVTGDDKLFIPSGFTGKMPNGDTIDSNSSFISIRTFMKKADGWDKVQAYLDGGEAPTFTYHRFWAQVDIATAFADYARLIDAPAAS